MYSNSTPERTGLDLVHMRRALELAALAASEGEVPVGAIVVDGEGLVLAEARNARERTQDPCGHAEVLAIRAAAAARHDWRLERTTLYVTLEPCAMCVGAILLARVPRVVFGAYDPKGGFCGTVGDLTAHPKLNHRFEAHGGVLADEASAQLAAFFAALRASRRSGGR